MLGQHFSKVFGIKFLDKDEKEKLAWTTSWGLSTRTIGAIIMVHGDDKGLVLPPKIAPVQIAIVPIIFKDKKDEVMAMAKEISKQLKANNLSVELDDRDTYTPGWKFNEWEMKGTPLRIEIGPRDVEAKQVVMVRRDTNEKITVSVNELGKKAEAVLESIQSSLFEKAKNFLLSSIVEAKDMNAVAEAVKNKKIAKVMFCNDTKCEDSIKDKADGATCRCIPFEQKPVSGNCVCGKPAKVWALFGKGY